MSNEERDVQAPSGLSAEQVGRVYNSLVDEFVRESGHRNSETWAKICESIDSRSGRPGLARVSLDPTPRRRRRWPAAVLAAAILAAGSWSISSLEWFDHEQGLTYVVKGAEPVPVAGDSGSTGERLVTSETDAVELRFSDKSLIRLEPHSSLGVSISEGGRVSARLTQGRLQADIEHQEATDYRFLAGSYEVQVVGTSFLLGYQQAEKRFDLVMTEGKVVVVEKSGKMHMVVAGQELHFDSVPASQQLQASASIPSTKPADEPASEVRVSPSPSPVPSTDFRALARVGRFQEIVAQSRTLGLEQVLAERSAGDLQELAQAARYTGEFALAERVWLKMRTRFAGGTSGTNAVFFLGRLAEQRGRLSPAIDYYDQYLNSGTSLYAAEAMGRKLELVRRSRGEQAARPVALQYLKRFPGGAYASVAQELSTSE